MSLKEASVTLMIWCFFYMNFIFTVDWVLCCYIFISLLIFLRMDIANELRILMLWFAVLVHAVYISKGQW